VYVPEFNRIKDRSVALAFMREHPFAIVVSGSEDVPFATHIPILVLERADQVVLAGHVAKANPHWKLLQQGHEALVIFHGPHAYVSPTLYQSRESVPTWNYAAVHAYGRPTVFPEGSRLLEIVLDTLQAFDTAYLDQWSSLREEYRSGMLKHIVGFEVAVNRLEGKFKLSQNRPKRDQANVIQSLQESEDSGIREIARLMKQEGLGS
jgi:transcriptional regulator